MHLNTKDRLGVALLNRSYWLIDKTSAALTVCKRHYSNRKFSLNGVLVICSLLPWFDFWMLAKKKKKCFMDSKEGMRPLVNLVLRNNAHPQSERKLNEGILFSIFVSSEKSKSLKSLIKNDLNSDHLPFCFLCLSPSATSKCLCVMKKIEYRLCSIHCIANFIRPYLVAERINFHSDERNQCRMNNYISRF